METVTVYCPNCGQPHPLPKWSTVGSLMCPVCRHSTPVWPHLGIYQPLPNLSPNQKVSA